MSIPLPQKSELSELLSYLKPRELAEMDSLLAPQTIDWRSLIHHVSLTEHPKQLAFVESHAKRKVARAGRRGGKTFGAAEMAIRAFEAGRRVLYGAPTQDQIETFWFQVKWALAAALDTGLLYKHEGLHIIEVPGTKNRIRAKTAWNAEMLRGDYADLLILDEFQLMNEDAWGQVGAPMLIDNNGDAVFIYTPPSLHSRVRSKARDMQYAAKLYKKAGADTSGRWAAFHWTSHDNPHISVEALDDIVRDMTTLAYEQEIMAEDKDEAPNALWKRETLDNTRLSAYPDLRRVVIGVDPPGGSTECGIVVAGLGVDKQVYVLDDYSLQDSPANWAAAVIQAYTDWLADRIVAEKNFGGDMVEHTLRKAEGGAALSIRLVTASRGKAVRAEPVAAQYERGKVHHVGAFSRLEDELCMWTPDSGQPSPNRLDALVWAITELMFGRGVPSVAVIDRSKRNGYPDPTA